MIQITPQIVISADHHQYIVGRLRERTDKGGAAALVLDKPTYHTTLASAVKCAISFALRDGVADVTITTLQEFIQEQRRLHAELSALLESLDCEVTSE